MSRFAFKHPIEVRFGDLDMLGHVNNAAYLTFLESARIAYWLQVAGLSGLEGINMILARAELDYKAPLGFGDVIDIGVACTALRRSSFDMEFEIVERASGRVAAQARKVCVYYDYAEGRSMPIPPELRDKIRAQDPDVLDHL